MTARFQLSAGGVVCRRDMRGELEAALIATHEGQRWGLSTDSGNGLNGLVLIATHEGQRWGLRKAQERGGSPC